MPADLHLFSTPGKNNINDIVEACRPSLEGKDDAKIAFLPLASFEGERWLDYTRKQFKVKKEEEIIREIKDEALIYSDAQKVFLADGNAMVLSTKKLLTILAVFNKKLPKVRRV